MVQEPTGRAVIHDVPTVLGQLVTQDREVALSQARRFPGSDAHLPEVTVLPVLVEGKRVVLRLVPLGFLGGPLFLREEVDRLAVSRPFNARRRCRMITETTGFATRVADQKDLLQLTGRTRCQERDPLPVRGKAWATLAVRAPGELDLAGTVHIDSPNMSDVLVRGPVRVASDVDQLAAVGRQLRIRNPRDVQ